MYIIFISFNFPIVHWSYKKFNRVLYIEVVSCHLAKCTYSSSFFADSLGFSTSSIPYSANRKFCFFLSNLYTCCLFFLPVTTARTSRKMVNKGGKIIYPGSLQREGIQSFTSKHDVSCRFFRLSLSG